MIVSQHNFLSTILERKLFNFNKPRKEQMRPILFFGIAIFFLTTSCSLNQQNSRQNENSTTRESPKVNVTQQFSTKPSYEILSPTKIRNGNILLEISTRLTRSNLEFRADATLPPKYEPATLESTLPELFSKVEFIFPSAAIVLEQNGGGGGGAPINGFYTVNQESAYRTKTPLISGQKIAVTIMVTFGKFTGIAEPVPFTLTLVVE